MVWVCGQGQNTLLTVMTKTFAARPHANAQRQRKSLPYYVESSRGAWEKFPHFIADFCIKYASCMRKRTKRLACSWEAVEKQRKEFALLKSSQHTCRSERQKLRIRHARRDKSASDIWIFLFKFCALAPFLGCVFFFWHFVTHVRRNVQNFIKKYEGKGIKSFPLIFHMKNTGCHAAVSNFATTLNWPLANFLLCLCLCSCILMTDLTRQVPQFLTVNKC